MSNIKIIPIIEINHKELLGGKSEIIALSKSYDNGGADEILLRYSIDGKEEKKALWEEFLALANNIAKVVDIPFLIEADIDNLEDIKLAIYTGAHGVFINNTHYDKNDLIKQASERFGNEKIFETLSPFILEVDFKELENSTYETNPMVKNKSFKGLKIRNIEPQKVMETKHLLKARGFSTNTFESAKPFSEFKLNENSLIPVITQDYVSGEVLMLAYMNEESYNKTIATGIMTYYSRSRKELWIKGETSGHYQYTKSLSLDCDNDTILAKVVQTGVACHTGAYSCFFQDLMTKEYDKNNPLKILEKVYDTIILRKNEPKKGSYTNYLLDEGIDKILKKCGEEATEIIIAAKNPDEGELRYEIADFLYHMMVLMVESGLSWDDITGELSRRN